jgi:hypothetical protein
VPRGVPHGADKKARTIHALLTGASIADVVEAEHLSPATVSAWRAEGAARLGYVPEKAAELDGLLLAYLRTGLATLVLQAEQFADAAWYKRGSPADAAVLHGVLADKLLRILEAQPQPDGP